MYAISILALNTEKVSETAKQAPHDPLSVFYSHLVLPSPSLIILHDLFCTLRRTCICEVAYRLAELPGGVDDAVI